VADFGSLIVKRRGVKIRTVPLDADQITIGLDPGCGLTLPDENRYVSRLHCTLDRMGGAWWLHDNASRNGVFINDQRVDGRAKLYHGDVIRIVEWEITFRDPASTNIAPEVDAPRPEPGPSLQYDLSSMRLFISGEEFDRPLSRQERTLLNCLAEKPGQVCTYEELIQALWEGVGDEAAIHGLVRRLRSKIEPDPSHAVFIMSVPGFGYRLDANPPTHT
jgi:predicted component of type VI protein secretion system